MPAHANSICPNCGSKVVLHHNGIEGKELGACTVCNMAVDMAVSLDDYTMGEVREEARIAETQSKGSEEAAEGADTSPAEDAAEPAADAGDAA